MEKSPVISVIVPMYKVEKYIRRCLESLKNQTFTDFEVLMINDGSPDKSAEIAEEFSKSDSRFILFNKKNGGLSDARNYGIQRAKGEYLAFVDSDDYVHKDYLYVLYHECADNDADMSYCRFKYSLFMSAVRIAIPLYAGKEVMKKEDALNILIRDNFLHSYAWNKLYKKTLFTDNNITYPDMYFEDIATSGRLLFNSNKMAVSDRYLYYYEKRFGSIMATMNARQINDYLRSVLIVRNYIQYMGIYDKYKKSVRSFARKARILNIYSILRQHILHWDFRKLKYNFTVNRDLYRYITSDDYKAVDGFPELPIKLVQPGRKKQ